MGQKGKKRRNQSIQYTLRSYPFLFYLVSVHGACIPGIPVHFKKMVPMDGAAAGNSPDSRPRGLYTRNPRPFQENGADGRGRPQKLPGIPSTGLVYSEPPSISRKWCRWTGAAAEIARIPVHRACILGTPVHPKEKLPMDGGGRQKQPGIPSTGLVYPKPPSISRKWC